MSSRQTSFFEQDHRRKYNGYRHPNRPSGHQRAVAGDRALQAPETPRPAIAASMEAKMKLGSFHFDHQTRVSPHRSPGKENRPMHGQTALPKRQSAAVADATRQDAVDTCAPPSTPAVRLPLADLLGHDEDARPRALEKEKSPEEHLGWGPTSPRGQSTPAGGRKRAQSSSPTTSSQAEASSHFIGKGPIDLQQMQQALQTPKADPTAELWSRYNISTGEESSTAARIPSLAHLLQESPPEDLPRTPGGSVNGLRRWASCGNEWPPTRNKRRKVHHDIMDRSGLGLSKNSTTGSGGSRLGAMLDQVQANLVKPSRRLRHKEPSSSSPLPERQSFEKTMDGSPGHEVATRDAERRPTKAVILPQAEVLKDHSVSNANDTQSSDYGDDNIDLTELSVDEIPLDISKDKRQHINDPDSGFDEDCPYNYAEASGAAGTRSTKLAPIREEPDEFDDGDDLTAEDLEIAMSQIPTSARMSAAPRDTVNVPRYTQAASRCSPQRSRLIDKAQPNIHSDEDDFGGDELDDTQMEAAEVAATQAYEASSKSQGRSISTKHRKIQRYLVKDVINGNYAGDNGYELPEKVLLVEEEKSKSLKAVTLRQSWLDTHCNPGAFVHIVGHFNKTGQITIDDASNLIIVHPDHLVSATAVADSFDCLRKAVLQDRVKATNATSKATVYGSILHELFQIAMQHHQWDADFLEGLVQRLVKKYIEGLFEAGATDTHEAIDALAARLPELQAWASDFVRSSPSVTARAQCRNGKVASLAVTKLLDVEEHVWSPTYGLKGNVDATVEVSMTDDEGSRNLVVPFEVKTGKHQSASHQAQTALYTLLLSDRYDVDVKYGVLYYMENSVTHRIPAIRHELRHMVMQRNELASYVRERLSLPAMLKNEHKCGRCYAKTSCFLYHKLSENGTSDTAGVGKKFAQVVSKLQPLHQDFFMKWDHLLTKEETEMFRFRRELWTMLSTEREKLGRCFSEVVIEPESAHEDEDAQKINRFAYTFRKKAAASGFSFTESQITIGEPIVISSEQGHFALANGYVTKVSPHRISCAVDRRLHNARKRQPDFDEIENQSFASIMDVRKTDATEALPSSLVSDTQVVYRLDKDEFSNGMATVRNNLLAIMDDEVYRSYDLRKLLIENQTPQYKPVPSVYSLTGPASQVQINSDQKAAIDKIMSAQDYALVLGMPGTGKTTTIAHIIRALVARGKSVLLTSYTHTAVDNILLKLRDSSISVLRLGVLAKIHPGVQEFANLAALPRESIGELEEMYMTPQVVATTCLGINHQIFHKRIFDYCIVDEASQITLPVCLGPIRMAERFVLVGDHYQLPPLVQNKEAQEGGLDISLFKLLSDRQPASVVNLEHQYRMCAEIMHLSNTLIYSGRLKCGNDAVANRTLQLSKPDALVGLHQESVAGSQQTRRQQPRCGTACLLESILDAERKVVFVNTDRLSSVCEALSGQRITNPTEVAITHLLTSAILAQGVNPDQTGIITFYRSQLALLRQTVKHTSAETVEMHTADKFQGRDKEVVLLSCVRSNQEGNVGDLLRDWRRLNVAITRARSKFVIVGSRKTLEGDELWKKLIATVEAMDGIVDVDGSLLERHHLNQAPYLMSETSPRTGKPSPWRSPRKVLGESTGARNRGSMKKPMKKGKIGRELFLKNRPVSQDILNMIAQ